MCGIGAVYDPAGPVTGCAERMLDALHHRGPDGRGVHVRGAATLVHTRLAIIDVAGGDQPLLSEDRSCAAVVNGEIYNHLELRAALERCGHRFRTRSDCEVVVHGYEQWGDDVLGRLNGIFAIALWDDRQQRLLLARDPLGVKPLYWWHEGARLVAASEVHALLAAGARAALDPTALEHYLAWRFVPAPRTLFAGISKLAPAGVLEVREDRVPRVSSFRRPPGEELAGVAPERLAAELDAAIRAAVRRQMMSEVPYGAFLSGGLDSAVVTAAMASSDPDEPRPRTFTIGFPGHGGAVDERAAAASTASALGARHHATAMTIDDFLAELDASVCHVEEPCGSPSAIAALQLSRFAAAEVKVVLSGQGADEPLGGYQRHLAAAWMGGIDAVPAPLALPLRAAARALPRNERLKRAAELLRARSPAQRLLQIFEITAAQDRAALTGGDGAGAAAERAELARGVLEDVDDRDVLGQMLYLDTHLFLPDQLLLWGDKTSMAASLEQRVPFLDLGLIRLVERIPARLRVGLTERKRLYRRAIRGRVPRAVIERRKQPFATPYDAWLRAELGEEVLRRYAPGRPVTAHVRPAVVARLVAEHRSGRHDHKRILFCLLELSQWHARFVEAAAPTPVVTRA